MFSLKDVALGREVIKAVGLENTDDAAKLQNWRNQEQVSVCSIGARCWLDGW